jgi:hypothetical protein
VSVLAFRVLVPGASVLGTDQFPAPAAQTWRGVSLALAQGLRELGAVKIWSMVLGAVVGVVLTVLPLFPARRLPRGIARREFDGGCARAVGERAGTGAPAGSPVTVPGAWSRSAFAIFPWAFLRRRR